MQPHIKDGRAKDQTLYVDHMINTDCTDTQMNIFVNEARFFSQLIIKIIICQHYLTYL